jgi:hypothetical protein
MPESEFEVSPTTFNEAASPDNVRNASISRSTSPVAPFLTEKLVSKGATAQHVDTGIHDGFEVLDQNSVSVEETLQVEEMTEGAEEVRIAGTVTLGEQESMYVVEERFFGSKLDDLAVRSTSRSSTLVFTDKEPGA